MRDRTIWPAISACKNGDVLRSVNGHDLRLPDDFLRALAALGDEKNFVALDDGQWHETISIPGCDSPGVTQFEYVVNSVTSAPAVLRRIDLDAGTYAFDLSGIAGSLIVLGCMTEPLAELPAPGPSNRDVFNEYDYAAGTEFPATGVQLLELPAGAYQISVVALSLPAFEAELAVAPVE